MSTKKSDNPVLPIAKGKPANPWRMALRSNWLIPVLLLLLIPLGRFVETGGFVDRYSQLLIMMVGINIILAVSLQLINGISGQFSLGHAGFMAVGAYMAAYPAKTFSPDLHQPFAVLLFYIALATVASLVAAILLGLFVLVRRSRALHPSLPGILLLLILAWIITDVAASNTVPHVKPLLLWSHLITLFRFLFTWLLHHGLPIAAGASHLIPPAAQTPLTLFILLLGGGSCAAAAGLVIGIPTLRLRGDYLAIATLGFAEIIRVLITNSQPLGGALGLSGIPAYSHLSWVYAVAILCVITVWRLVRSARGRALLAVREDEIAASAIGIDATRNKVLAFVTGAFFAGTAGVLFAHYTSYITPTHFSFMRSIELVVMVTLAGAGSISGTILAAIVLTYLPEELRAFSQWRMVIYSLLLIALMLLRPEGLLGSRELWWTPKRSAPEEGAADA